MFGSVLRSVSLLTRRQKLALVLLSFATLAANLLDLIAIVILGLVGALALGGEAIDFGGLLSFSWFSAIDPTTLIISLLLGAGAIFFVKTIFGVLLAKVRASFLANVEIHFSQKIAVDLFSKDLTHIKHYSRSYIEWSLLRSTHTAFTKILGSTFVLFAEASLAFLVIGLLFYADWISALAVLFYFASVLLLFQVFALRRSGKSGHAIAEGSISVNQAVGDILAAFREASVHSRITFFLRRISNAVARVARGNAAQSYVDAIPRLIVELALILGALGFLAFQVARTSGSPDLGLIAVFVVGSLRIMSALLPLQRSYMGLRWAAGEAQASQDLLHEALTASAKASVNSVTKKPSTPASTPAVTGALSVNLNNVTFHYSDREAEEIVVDQVTLAIEPGSTVAFIGPSGAGKSTLVDLILGLHKPVSGHVLCSGFDPKALRDSHPGIMSYVPQKPGLVTGTIRDNIALGIPADEVDEEALWEAIQVAQIEAFIRDLPEGVDSHLGEHTDALSGGQIQRLGVARAVYTRPQLLVLDEATSALDAETEADITRSLYKLGNQTTRIIVAHRLSTVQHADMVFVVDKGKVIASGKLRDLEKNVPLVKKYIALMSFDS